VAKSIAALLKIVGLRFIVLDDRERYANSERFPDAAETYSGPWESLFSKLTIHENSYIIILTRGHQYDETILEWGTHNRSTLYGMIGSLVKIKKIYNHLADKGIDPSLFERVHAPIGLPIHSVTHEEIAVSIVAELISVRRQNLRAERTHVRFVGIILQQKV
jgi:xanthine dehydrogenase accessory factor